MTVAMPAAIHAPACAPRQLSLRVDGEDGAFDGMSHSGLRLIVRNAARAACEVPGLPRVTFIGANGRALPVTRRAPPGMHPGPVVVPVVLMPGDRVTTVLRWVSGEVFDRSRCFAPRRLRIAFSGGARDVSLTGRICAPADASATFDQPPLTS